MPTPQEIRKIRLSSDYKQMCNIKGDIVSWVPLKGTAPYIEEYQVTINIPTIISANGGTPQYRQSSVVIVTLPANYPTSGPVIRMTSLPIAFHPNWWDDGLWCNGTWFMSEALGDHVIRMIKTLQYDSDITNPKSPANPDANEWYVANKDRGIFPCDKSKLPDPTVYPSTVKPPSNSSFVRVDPSIRRPTQGSGFTIKTPAAAQPVAIGTFNIKSRS